MSMKLQLSWETMYAYKIMEVIIIIQMNAKKSLFLNTSLVRLLFSFWIQAVNKILFSVLLVIYPSIEIVTG